MNFKPFDFFVITAQAGVRHKKTSKCDIYEDVLLKKGRL